MAEPPTMLSPEKRKSARSARWENIARGLYRFRSNTLSMIGSDHADLHLCWWRYSRRSSRLIPEDAAGKTRVTARLQPPSADFAFGTDKIGRDIFSRVVMGTGLALQVGTVIILAGDNYWRHYRRHLGLRRRLAG